MFEVLCWFCFLKGTFGTALFACMALISVLIMEVVTSTVFLVFNMERVGGEWVCESIIRLR